MTTTLGKYRHLTQATTKAGHFMILAIDHRANLRELLGNISDAEFRDFKLQVIEASAGLVSGVLVDPGFGLGSVVARRAFSGGLLAPLEVTDYGVHPSQRETSWIPRWSIKKVKRMGADGVKLLLPFHPDLPSAAAKEETVRSVVQECAERDLPLYLEPIACARTPEEKLSPAEQRDITVAMTARFCAMGADVMKLQLPSAENEWEPTCRQLAEVCTAPWALLSGGVDFPTYCRQAEVACAHGASGVIVGRAVWTEATSLQGELRARFLREIVPQRLLELARICTSAAPWWDKASLEEPGMDWYEGYALGGR